MSKPGPLPKTPLRGEVYLVRLDPTVGVEVPKTRPAVILQDDVANESSRLTIIAPITSQTANRGHPSEVPVTAVESGGAKDGVILVNHIRAIDRRRLAAWKGQVTPDTMGCVEEALLEILNLSERLVSARPGHD